MTSEQTVPAYGGPGYLKYPEHKVAMRLFDGHVAVLANGSEVAASENAILLTETGYSPVYYLPRSDVDFDLLSADSLLTYCPFKGHARYWCLADDQDGKPVAWGYDAPFDEVETLSGYVAFYGDRVDMITRSDDRAELRGK